MPRIRTVKPEFFRHEKLQEMGPLSMLIFQGLWTQCDRAGRFAWKPKTLKLDILPFIDFNMESELNKLANAFFVIQYEANKEIFGVIPTFLEHQRLTGKEAIEPPKHPAPPEAKSKKTRKLPVSNSGSDGEASGKHSGSDETKPVSQEGKGNGHKEMEEEGKGDAALPHRVLDYLNRKSGKNFRNTDSNIRLIRARLSEGYSESDFQKAIDNKTADWLHDSKMEEYIRPNTIFQASKFDGYVNQINAGAKDGKDGGGGGTGNSSAERNNRKLTEQLGKITGAAGVGSRGGPQVLHLVPPGDPGSGHDGR